MKKNEIKILSEIFFRLKNHGFESEFSFKEFIEFKMILFRKGKYNYRFFVDSLVLQKGDDDFDRWANSVGKEALLKKLDADLFEKKVLAL